MKSSIRLGRVAGISLGIHWSALVIIVLIAGILGNSILPSAAQGLPTGIYWIFAVLTALLFFVSLLAHELAHALVARRRGIQVKDVTLWLLGGVTELDGETKTPRSELEISIAGPLTSLALAAVVGLVVTPFDGPPLLWAALTWLALINVMLGVFNLLPGAPLDGGRVLHAVLWWRYQDRARADRATARAGQALGVLLIGAGVAQFILWSPAGGLWTVLIGWFLSSAARNEAVGRTARERLAEFKVRDIMTPDPDLVPAWLDVEQCATGVMLGSRQTVFPVVDYSGSPVGSLSLQTVSRLTPTQRRSTRAANLARSLPPRHLLAPDEPAVRILDIPPSLGDLVAVVVESDHVIGMVTSVDLARILQQSLLRGTATAT
jgi:Zn-dependent protease